MIELRWVRRKVSHQPAGEVTFFTEERVLQYRTLYMHPKPDGFEYWPGQDADWQDVPEAGDGALDIGRDP